MEPARQSGSAKNTKRRKIATETTEPHESVGELEETPRENTGAHLSQRDAEEDSETDEDDGVMDDAQMLKDERDRRQREKANREIARKRGDSQSAAMAMAGVATQSSSDSDDAKVKEWMRAKGLTLEMLQQKVGEGNQSVEAHLPQMVMTSGRPGRVQNSGSR